MKISSSLEHGTIFCTTGEHKASAIFLNENIVITSGLILGDNEEYATKLSETVSNCPVVDVSKLPDLQEISQLDFRVVSKHNCVLREQAVKAYYIVYSQRVKECLENILDGLQICFNGETRPIRAYNTLYASLIILSTNSSSVASWEHIKLKLNNLKPPCCDSPKLLEKVVTVSTPFGNESFLNTINVGHITNIFGEQDCVLLLNNHLSFGCQGGAVYNHDMQMQGILIGSTFTYRNENVNLALAINIDEILTITLNRKNLCQGVSIPLPLQPFRSVCMIDSEGCWGTGCAFEMNRKHYIISCAHVLATDNITCVFNDRIITNPRLIYKNPIFDSAYDIALMEVSFEMAQTANWFCRLANYIPSIGQRLYAVGFPVFKSLAVSSFKPTIIPGRATKYSKGILFTDCSVQSGQSGGPIFDKDGLLVAIAVSNFKSSLDNQIYPFHNMCVPVGDIYSMILQYSDTNDKTSLKGLQADWSVKSKWKLKPPTILNKL
ncbi:peroxisomal leader peptide-processing protease [Anopheles nili]|uniref:peroxisomal leader peptide-processing protease n=1 Tax=Anopheles nili TaxID=185578 RepID=UPI00237C29CF|nr:peroxisomal leader peptide-processing protease [Anopheles nili]